MESLKQSGVSTQMEIHCNTVTDCNTDTMSEAAGQAILRQLRGMALSIDRFDGTSDIEDWLFDFELLAKVTGYNSDEDKARFLPFHLSGEAKRRYHDLSVTDKGKYSTIKGMLLEVYTPTTWERGMAKRAFYSRKQGQYETLKDYIAQAEVQSYKLGIPQDEAVAVVIHNARPTIRRLLKVGNYASLRELARSPLTLENFEDDLTLPELQVMVAELKEIQHQHEKIKVVTMTAPANLPLTGACQRSGQAEIQHGQSQGYKGTIQSTSKPAVSVI